MIETKRLRLRNFTLEDIEAYCKLTRDPDYQRFYSEEDCSESKARYLASLFAGQADEADRRKFQLAIELKQGGVFIGTAGVRLEDSHQASVGCGVDTRYHGVGYAEEAMRAIMLFAFEKHSVHRIYAETLAENTAAIRLCEKLGMRQEARFVEHRYFKHRWWDTVIMAMLKSEW